MRRVRLMVGWAKAYSKASPLAEVLRRYGVSVEEHAYYTMVKGEKYRRFKLVVRDESATRRLAALARSEVKLRRLMKRFESAVQEVLFCMGRIRGWRRLLDLIPARRLRRWLGIKPFKLSVYNQWRYRKIARRLKPTGELRASKSC